MSNEKTIEIKVIYSDVFNKFYVHDFLIWNHLSIQNLILKLPFIEINNLNFSNFVKWKDDQNISCTSWWVLQLWCLQYFHFRSFFILKFNSKFTYSNFKIFKYIFYRILSDLEWFTGLVWTYMGRRKLLDEEERRGGHVTPINLLRWIFDRVAFIARSGFFLERLPALLVNFSASFSAFVRLLRLVRIRKTKYIL